MSMQRETWMKHVESVAIGAQEVPMWGTIPSFPWKEFTSLLAESIGVKGLKISAGSAEWKKGNAILTGIGRSPLQLAIEMSPLKGSVSIVFPSEDFSKISSWTIHPDAGGEGFSDPYLQKGFFRFLCTEALSSLSELQTFQGLSLKLIDMPLAKEDAYCIDIAIEQGGETVWGRIICPSPFQESFRGHFSGDWNFSIPSTLYETIDVEMSLEAGKTSLSQEACKTLQTGDFVLLDQCSYYPNLNRGTFQLKIEETPLFQAKLKEDAIKLLDYAHYFEDNTMDEETFDEELGEETSEGVSVEEAPEAPMVNPKAVPVSLSVEVARMKMNLDKLLKLKPGNVLELGVQVEKGVNLVANGKCIGKGELLQIGEVIGVKIVKLGE